MSNMIRIRKSDNVLDNDCQSIAKLMVMDDQVAALNWEQKGVYDFGEVLGMTLEELAKWSCRDDTGCHPEQYNSVWLGKNWQEFVSVADLKALL